MVALTRDGAALHAYAAGWRDALASWAIPPEIVDAAPGSPWELPRPMFIERSRAQLDAPSGLSFEVAVDLLPPGGSVLDVGAGAGAASLALGGRAAVLASGGRAAGITAVDEDAVMLAACATLAAESGVACRTIRGRWPDVAADVPVADVVVCHHVLYNVPDVVTFLHELTRHARAGVVVEITAEHPVASTNPLWMALHGLERPRRPVAADLVAILDAMGLEPRWRAWQRPATPVGKPFDEVVAEIGRRLCVGPERAGDVAAALAAIGVTPDTPYLGGATRHLVTLWWAGIGR